MSLASIPKPETPEERFSLVRSVGEECVTDADLQNLILKKPSINCYDGFEPSGRMHIAQGIFKSINVNKCTTAGCKFIFWVADWFALMNDKMGGDLAKIQTVGEYLVEVWSAAGMDMANVEFRWSSKDINQNAAEYWGIVLDIARRNTLARITKCCTIMGKKEGGLSAAQIMYPLMQCADVFFLKADICQLGLDQRKCNMLAREYCDQIGRKLKPVILSHHMLAGLKEGQAKMSKSDPESAIFMEDSAEDVERKIKNAYFPCTAQVAKEIADDGAPEASADTNPCLDYAQCIIFSHPCASFTVGDKTFTKYADIEAAVVNKEVGEEAFKKALIVAINELLEPVREHFRSNEKAKTLLETIKAYKKEEMQAPAAPPAPEVLAPHLVVFVPSALHISLCEAWSLADTVKAFLAKNADGRVTLLQPDWSCVARNELTGEAKHIKASLDFNTKLLSLAGLPASVEIKKQSEVVLENPSDYWVHTINVGRKYNVARVTEAVGGEIANAGQVIAALMRVTDAVQLKATAVATLASDFNQNALIVEHTNGRVVEEVLATGLPPLCDPTTTPNPEDILYADDADKDIKAKIKKAFAAEKDATTPVIGVAHFLLTSGRISSLTIGRSEANGGPLEVSTLEELQKLYADGSVHPGDLKPAVSQLLLSLTDATRVGAGQGDMKVLSKMLKDVEKKLTKKK